MKFIYFSFVLYCCYFAGLVDFLAVLVYLFIFLYIYKIHKKKLVHLILSKLYASQVYKYKYLGRILQVKFFYLKKEFHFQTQGKTFFSLLHINFFFLLLETPLLYLVYIILEIPPGPLKTFTRVTGWTP